MNKSTVSVLIAFILVLAAVSSYTDDQLIDVVHLKDGTVLEGLIIDQDAGVSVKLATAERIVYTLADQEIDRVVKKKTREQIPFSYGDVVLLKDGVMFRGTIVEQRPQESIVLETDNEMILTFPTEDIWKILKEKRVDGKEVEEAEKRSRNERERLKIVLQIELVRDEIRKQEEKRDSGGHAEDALEGEIDRLKEQMQNLEEAEEQIEEESVTDRRIEERERLEELEMEIEELLKELTEMLEQCEKTNEAEQTAYLFTAPKMRPLRLLTIGGFASNVSSEEGLPAADRKSDEKTAERIETAAEEIVTQTIYKIPTEEEIDTLSTIQASYAALVDVLGSRKWKRLTMSSYVRGLAEALPVEDRVFLYEINQQKGAVLGMTLNIIPLVFLGSWVQGDIWGALIGIAQTALCINFGTDWVTQDAINQGYTGPFTAGYFPGDMGALFWAGVGLITVSYAFGFIEPFWYVGRINKRLKDRLLLDDETIREVKREERRLTLNPPALKIAPSRDDGLGFQLDLVSVSY